MSYSSSPDKTYEYLISDTLRKDTAHIFINEIIHAMQENVKKYEDKHGRIKPAAEPEHKTHIGFKP